MPTTTQDSTGQVNVPSLVVRDNNNVDTGDRFVLGTELQILGSDASGALLQVSGPNADGQPTIGFVKKEFVSIDQPAPAPARPGPAGPPPAPVDAPVGIDPSLVSALRTALKDNEIGDDSPYKLSYALNANSGASFGVFQGDTNVDADAQTTLSTVLTQFGIDPTKTTQIVSALSRKLPNGSPLSADDEKLVNAALSSPEGKALVDAMDARTFQIVEGELQQCIGAAATRNCSIDPVAQIAIGLWVNMSGKPSVLTQWLSGNAELGLPPAAGPSIARPDMEAYLRRTDYFTLFPKQFGHFSASVDAGANALAGQQAAGGPNRWIYSQRTGRMYHKVGGVPILIARGYSGNGPGEDNPDDQFLVKEGPIPRGLYQMGPPEDFNGMHNCISLSPNQKNNMGGRAGFLIHDGDFNGPHGKTSEGCICLQPTYRLEIWSSGDHTLEVVQDDPVTS